ncbi:alanine racemase [Marinicella sp. S1101]|uniref:alanine racemase n=1 Tax=Marinicella marina TaxID=2996016 RepID=UPI0022609803|nr:alanine racemase [Marinicella marina]MCX7553411.1 alanine racemase [Marinicella marina]MDJ1140035.1 alanine racemase [Marinicella marina]
MSKQPEPDTSTFRERGTQAVITPSNITKNLNTLKQSHPGKTIAVIKANAYGHGVDLAVPALAAADAFAVAAITEAQKLRSLSTDKRIILLEGVFNQAELIMAQQQQFDVVVHQDYQLDILKDAHPNTSLDVWLKIDTGMNRLGFDITELDTKLRELQAMPVVKQIRLMSHFASSDDKSCTQTQQQLSLNQHLKSKGFEYSFSNTAAVLNQISDPHEWVRVGLGLFGISPLPAPHFAASFNLAPAMHLSANVIATKHIPKGAQVGYCATYTAPEDMRIAIVGIGYADGYPWSHLSSSVLIKNQLVAVLGRVSMDMIAIDVSKFNEPLTGEEVTIWGEGLPVEQVASDLEMIPYALVCGVTQRVKYYVNQ